MRGIKKKIRDNRYLNWLLIISNWLLQGILNADVTEKVYRIIFTFTFGCILFLLLYSLTTYGLFIAIILSFVIAHTINWLVNGNFFSLLVHRLLMVSLSKKRLFGYMDSLEKRFLNQNWILYCAVFGSICKGKLKDSSDIDVSIVRKPGFANAVKAILFSIKEKKIADIKHIPLEIFVSDTPQDSIRRFAGEDNPVALYDPDNVIRQFYSIQLSINEARKLNKVE